MAMAVGAADEDEDVISAINTTPLVDVMLVLLIIFLITIPVIVPEVAVKVPQPEVLIRGDLAGRYDAVGKVVFACQRAGIQKIGFVTEPPARN